MAKSNRLPVAKAMCATCPFREGSQYAYLQSELTACALNTASRICHSTGSNAINHRTGKPPVLCRGTRNVQLKVMAAMRVIDAPTDEAWEKKCEALGL